MTFLPIVQRELSVRARSKSTWRVRLYAAILAILVALPMLMLTKRTGPGGQQFFYLLTGLSLVFCLFEGARQTADAISGERREGTLGLLFLTDLKAHDIILGKSVVTSVSSLYGLLAIFPVLGLGLLAGGIAPAEFWRMMLVLITTLLLSLTIGLWVSSRNVHEQKCILATALILIGMAGLSPLIDANLGLAKGKHVFSLCSPAYACFLAFDAGYRTSPNAFWYSQLMAVLLAGGFLIGAARGILKVGLGERDTARRERFAIWRRRRRRRLLNGDPIAWLVSRKTTLSRALTWIAAIALIIQCVHTYQQLTATAGRAAVGGAIVQQTSFASIGMWLLFWLLTAYVVCDLFSELRRTGILELLLCSPQRPRDIIRGYVRAITRVLAWPFGSYIAMHIAGPLPYLGSSGSLWIVIFIINPILIISLGLSLIHAGAWFTVSSEKLGQATGKTLLVVLVVPWLIMIVTSPFLFLGLRTFFPALQYLPWIATNVFIFLWARRQLATRFRETAVAAVTGERPVWRARPREVDKRVEDYFGLLR